VLAVLAGLLILPHWPVPAHRLEASLVADPGFLADRPELLAEAHAVQQTRALASRGEERAALLNGKWSAFTHVAFSPSIGNPQAPRMLIEFTDYTCAPCRTSAPLIQEALAEHPDVRVAIMLLPTGGAMSELAARIALAAYRQNPERFAALHERLMTGSAPLDQHSILAHAKAAGYDVEDLQSQISNPAHRRYLEQVRALSQDMAIVGVPAFASGSRLVLGGLTREKVEELLRAAPVTGAASGTVTAQRPFNLVDPRGAAVSATDFLGEWLLVTFGFTHCPDTCPLSMATLAGALKLLGPEAERVRVALVSVDPARDTPQVMGQYVAAFNPRFVGLTGTAKQIDEAMKSFGVYAVAQPRAPDGSYSVDHSSAFYLVDPRGRFTRQFSAQTAAKPLAASLRKILNEHRG
jgi:protein SCO1/2